MYICGIRCDIFILVDKKYWSNEAQFSHLHHLVVSLFGDFEFLSSSNSTCIQLWLPVFMLKNTIIHLFYLTMVFPLSSRFQLLTDHCTRWVSVSASRQETKTCTHLSLFFFNLFQPSSSVHFVLMDISVISLSKIFLSLLL